MIIHLSPAADARHVQKTLAAAGVWTRAFVDADDAPRVLSVGAHSQAAPAGFIEAIDGVDAVFRTPSPHPRLDAQAGRPVRVGDVDIGPGAAPVLIAGPCSVESAETAMGAAARAAAVGARLLRGGAFKPRTSPYAFQGAGHVALGWLRDAADAHGLKVVTEVLSERDAGAVADCADLLQIGSRNMQNYALLKVVGGLSRPIMLKRGISATIAEWKLAAEYCLNAGAPGVIFCERGVRGFDDQTRNLLDLGAVALMAHGERQPVLVDPAHAVGRRDLIAPLAGAGIAAGAHGVMVETHPDPTLARSDAAQALTMDELEAVAAAMEAHR